MGGNACGPFSVREKTMHRDSFFQTLFLLWGAVRVNFNRQHGLETATLQNRNVNKRHKDGWNCNRKREKQKYSGKIPKATWLPRKVLAKRVSRRPINAHFWKKYKESSLNLLKFYGKALPSGWPVFNVWLKACFLINTQNSTFWNSNHGYRCT